jgi:hypothetical protein
MADYSKVLQKQLTMMGFFDVTSEAIHGCGDLREMVHENVASLPLRELAFVLVDVAVRSLTRPGHVGLNVRFDLSYGAEVIDHVRGELDACLDCAAGAAE